MTATLIERSRMDGVRLTLTPSGTVKANGDREALARWLPIFREHKAALVAFLSAPNPITTDEETALRDWLAHVEERDPEMIADFFDQCRNDPKALAGFLRDAEEVRRAGNGKQKPFLIGR